MAHILQNVLQTGTYSQNSKFGVTEFLEYVPVRSTFSR